jgi:hypothetical protein
MMIRYGSKKDEKGRTQIIYYDTDDLSDEDFFVFMQLKEKDYEAAKNFLKKNININ